MKTFALFVSGLALAVFASGCAHHEGAYEPKNTTKGNLEDVSQFVLFDEAAPRSVTSPGVQTSQTPDGRLKVSAKLRNRENRRIEVQVNCEFKDAQGFPVDSTPFRTVILDENATEAVSFEAINKNAVRYTIRVRQAR
ncbi:MAG TPA: YcfL family protein [Methylomirabilota bacterium]|nr:YcfL family protein [Methylomirabilota bacterium]